MSKWNFTVDDIMDCDPCSDYPRDCVEELFGDRVTVTPEDILASGILVYDIGWIVTNLAWRHNIAGLRNCYCKYTSYEVDTAAARFDTFQDHARITRVAILGGDYGGTDADYLNCLKVCFEE